jgi:hypothetical protein
MKEKRKEIQTKKKGNTDKKERKYRQKRNVKERANCCIT